MNYVNLIIQVLANLVVVIPLVVELVKYVQKAIKEKNWSKMITLLTNLIIEAESKFETGAEKKEWVISMIKASADTIQYDITEEQLSALIDSTIALTKQVNTK